MPVSMNEILRIKTELKDTYKQLAKTEQALDARFEFLYEKNPNHSSAQFDLINLEIKRDSLRATGNHDGVREINNKIKSVMNNLPEETREFIKISTQIAHIHNQQTSLQANLSVLDRAISENNPAIAETTVKNIKKSN